jgi:hypothetical protein
MKRYVFVAGVDYEFKGVNFRIFCESRIKRAVNANRIKEDLTFTIVDFKSGEVVTRKVTYARGKKTETVSKDARYSAISQANYDRTGSGRDVHYRFKNGQTNVMSILDVYAEVQQIGVNNPGELQELSVFSHGWMGGPLLVNSFDDGNMTIHLPLTRTPITVPLSAADRDPDDMDPRAPKDFTPPTMSAADLLAFQQAFRSDGLIWIWGCAFPRVVHEILHKLEHNPAYRSSGLGDDVLFTFTNLSDAHVTSLARRLRMLFPNPRRVEIEFKHLKQYFCRSSIASYSQIIADNAKVHVFGALIGTYSEYDTGPTPLMHVHKGFARHFQFYKNYLGFSFDPEGRMYGEYKPGTICPPPGP